MGESRRPDRSTGRGRLTYANVVSTIGIFLLLAGGTAIAAKQLAKKSVGAKQLKKNSVTTAKLKKAAVTKAKLAGNAVDATTIADGAVGTADLADGSVTPAKIDAANAPLGRKIAHIQKSETVPFTGGSYPLGAFTQKAGESLQLFGTLEVEFGAGCAPPRSAFAYLMLDATNPLIPLPSDIAGIAIISDTGAGAVRRKAEFIAFAGVGSALYRTAPGADSTRKLDVLMNSMSCSAGSGGSLTGVSIDALGTR